MEIGPLSEWVAAVAELLAVCVALFLPYINNLRASKRRQAKFRKTIATLAQGALHHDEMAQKQLQRFVMTAFFISSNLKEQDIVETGMQIDTLLQHQPLNDAQTAQLINLIDSLK